MSTKITLVCGKGFHIYRDCNCPGFVFIANDEGDEVGFPDDVAKDIGILR